jgi:hypothetical protein
MFDKLVGGGLANFLLYSVLPGHQGLRRALAVLECSKILAQLMLA